MIVNGEWNIVGFSDSDFGGDKETRISVAGFIIYLMGSRLAGEAKVRRVQ